MTLSTVNPAEPFRPVRLLREILPSVPVEFSTQTETIAEIIDNLSPDPSAPIVFNQGIANIRRNMAISTLWFLRHQDQIPEGLHWLKHEEFQVFKPLGVALGAEYELCLNIQQLLDAIAPGGIDYSYSAKRQWSQLRVEDVDGAVRKLRISVRCKKKLGSKRAFESAMRAIADAHESLERDARAVMDVHEPFENPHDPIYEPERWNLTEMLRVLACYQKRDSPIVAGKKKDVRQAWKKYERSIRSLTTFGKPKTLRIMPSYVL